ncbi:hypothetical protein FB45DRAFT_210328 [Roridomyces roridus]|uniref:F-box domain-containing protein n=1 Tax=Roridomyces roridus TaxID=1738132 RepID=A0AAD7FZP2_9AGAR|nr:hypothetical protein FB45DRAFT_210328 [Roridomyces roridus]
MTLQSAAAEGPEALTWVFEAEPPLEPSETPREILACNEPTPEIHVPSLQAFIARGISRRTRLDSKIAVLQAALKKTVAERNLLAAEIREHQGALSPLRGLPIEILASIFVLLPSENLLAPGASGPWCISAVCSRWRAIALSLPSLWTDVTLNFRDGVDVKDMDINGVLLKLEVHLERSAQLPLALDYTCFSDDEPGVVLDQESLTLGLLGQHCNRWESLKMVGPEKLFLELALRVKNALPLLSTLDIYVYPVEEDDDLDEDVDLLGLFKLCPRLQAATVNADRYCECTTKVSLPFHQLLQYRASNPRSVLIELLGLTTNLVDCVLHVQSDLHPAPERIQLPNLLRLSVSSAEILDDLDTPVIRELYCDHHSHTLYSYLERHRELRKVVVTRAPSAPDIPRLLSAVQGVTDLALCLPGTYASDFLRAMAHRSINSIAPGPPPSLTSLSVCFEAQFRPWNLKPSPGLSLDEDLLMRTIESHSHSTGEENSGSGWRAVRLYFRIFNFKPATETLERMQVFREQGMQIHISQASFGWSEVPRYFQTCG